MIDCALALHVELIYLFVQMWMQTEGKRMDYWRDYGAPPNLPRTRNTTIYMPDEEAEMLTDFQAECIPPVDQMTEINEGGGGSHR